MKKIFKKNQVIITALAIMIAVAGYINYSDNHLGIDKTLKKASTNTADDKSKETADADSKDASAETPGEAVLTGASNFVAQAKVSREQVRSANKETLLEIINNENIGDEQKQEAIASMVKMTDLAEQEEAAELLLDAKGFENVVVNLTNDSADVIVPQEYMADDKRAQIEDIVKRKTSVPVENIVITPMDEGTSDGE